MTKRTNAWWDGYIAAEAGKHRYCRDPWNAQYQQEWLDGWDSYQEDKFYHFTKEQRP